MNADHPSTELHTLLTIARDKDLAGLYEDQESKEMVGHALQSLIAAERSEWEEWALNEVYVALDEQRDKLKGLTAEQANRLMTLLEEELSQREKEMSAGA